MDPLRNDDVEQARKTTPGERAAQVLELMSLGIELKRASLRQRFSDETDDAIERRLQRWLARNG